MSKSNYYLDREDQCRTLVEAFATPSSKQALTVAAESWKFLRELEEDPARFARPAAPIPAPAPPQ
jgi:hypothetical protein